jgi:hypothetical protein
MRSIVAVAAAFAASAAFATEVVIVTRIPTAPTLSEIGLGALMVIMAAAAGWVIRKRK